MVLGFAMIGLSLLTRYEFGAVRLIPVPAHLAVDGLSGALLALSPWLFGFAGIVYLPHLILGLIELGTSLMTETNSSAPERPALRA
jgi:hypothetical protein